jgi:hypothetical protein
MSKIQNLRKNKPKLDFYATHPDSIRSFLKCCPGLSEKRFWEPAAGTGNICSILKEFGHHDYFASDIEDYGATDHLIDFLDCEIIPEENIDAVITNPPFNKSLDFVYKFLDLFKQHPGTLGIFYVKLLFLETKKRYELFKKYPPKTVYIHSSRQGCSPDGDFDFTNCGAVAYCWIVWEIGYQGDTIIKWIPPN